MRLPDTFGALRERDFRLLFLGQAISWLGTGMVPLALAFAVLDVTHSVSDLGFVSAARALPLVVFLLAGGVFADRLPRRAVMIGADLVRLASQGLLAGLLVAGVARLWEIVALVTVLLWRSLIKIYSHAQIALRETLSQPPPPRPAQVPAPLPGFLREADLETMTIAADAPAVGKLIRELELRTRTGASIVGIERNGGERIINPGPDEELQSGDQLLLVGTRAQLDSVKSLFSKPT